MSPLTEFQQINFKQSSLYAVTPQAPASASRQKKWLHNIELALRSGLKLLQYRDKQLRKIQQVDIARQLKNLCASYGCIFLVNDSLDIALASDADGVHLGSEDAAITQARAQLGGDKIIGASCYQSLKLATKAYQEGADYLAFGSCFPSGSKPQAKIAPLELITQAKQKYLCPIVAIGGITIENCTLVKKAGADLIAVIGGLFDSENIADVALQLNQCKNQTNLHTLHKK